MNTVGHEDLQARLNRATGELAAARIELEGTQAQLTGTQKAEGAMLQRALSAEASSSRYRTALERLDRTSLPRLSEHPLQEVEPVPPLLFEAAGLGPLQAQIAAELTETRTLYAGLIADMGADVDRQLAELSQADHALAEIGSRVDRELAELAAALLAQARKLVSA